jgi:hypothetical protein
MQEKSVTQQPSPAATAIPEIPGGGGGRSSGACFSQPVINNRTNTITMNFPLSAIFFCKKAGCGYKFSYFKSLNKIFPEISLASIWSI